MEKSTGVLPLVFFFFGLFLPFPPSIAVSLFLYLSPTFLTFLRSARRTALPSFSRKKKRDAQNDGED